MDHASFSPAFTIGTALAAGVIAQGLKVEGRAASAAPAGIVLLPHRG